MLRSRQVCCCHSDSMLSRSIQDQQTTANTFETPTGANTQFDAGCGKAQAICAHNGHSSLYAAAVPRSAFAPGVSQVLHRL